VTLLSEATDAEITAELVRRADQERATEFAAITAWNEENADALLRIVFHNPHPFKVREGPHETFVERTCTDMKPRANKSSCVRCALLKMVETKNWSGYRFHLDTSVTILDW
jgi:hypothetical protein